MAPTYKLTYFPVMAFAEPIRWLLSYGNLPFEDVRVSPEDWKILKQQFDKSIYLEVKFGILPVFEVDGKVMYQSVSICRYVGKMVGLAGRNDWENFEIDMVADFVTDLREKISYYNKLPNSSIQRPSLKESLIQDTIPYYLNRFEKIVENGGFLANKKLSWADIYFTALLDYMNGVLEMEIVNPTKYPMLDKIRTEVRSIPEIAAWIHKRPWSEY